MFIYVNHLFIREDIKAHQDVETIFLTLPSVAAKQNDVDKERKKSKKWDFEILINLYQFTKTMFWQIIFQWS